MNQNSKRKREMSSTELRVLLMELLARDEAEKFEKTIRKYACRLPEDTVNATMTAMLTDLGKMACRERAPRCLSAVMRALGVCVPTRSSKPKRGDDKTDVVNAAAAENTAAVVEDEDEKEMERSVAELRKKALANIDVVFRNAGSPYGGYRLIRARSETYSAFLKNDRGGAGSNAAMREEEGAFFFTAQGASRDDSNDMRHLPDGNTEASSSNATKRKEEEEEDALAAYLAQEASRLHDTLKVMLQNGAEAFSEWVVGETLLGGAILYGWHGIVESFFEGELHEMLRSNAKYPKRGAADETFLKLALGALLWRPEYKNYKKEGRMPCQPNHSCVFRYLLSLDFFEPI